MSEPTTVRKREPRLLALVILAIVLAVAFAVVFRLGRSLALAQSDPRPGGKPVATDKPVPGSVSGPATWKEVDRLVDEQKFEAASALATRIREAAAAKKDDPEWTKALVREVQLRSGLHGFETTVRFLREQPWPQSERSHDVLSLFYAHSLVTYYQAYSWEINQREKVDTKGVVDLKAWTKEEIAAEAEKAYGEVWAHRAGLGREAADSLPDYLMPNSYPKGVRPTLRDAVTYLYAELLADSSLWTPKQSNELFALDLGALLGKERSTWWDDGKDPSQDRALHPLARACALYDDLESWHRSRGEKEPALEVRLVRLNTLHGHLSREEDRARIRKDLATRLPDFRAVPWYATGMAQLAEFTEAEEAPDALVRARALALIGRQAYPESPGGQRCDHIRARIEAPSFDLEAMGSDAPGKRSIRIRHKNLRALHLRAVPFDLSARVGSARDYNLLPQWDEARKILQEGTAEAQWQAALPETPDYRLHDTYVTPPVLPPGVYVLGASADTSFKASGNRVEAVVAAVSDLVLLRRDDGEGGHEVQVWSGAEGLPLKGVEVLLYEYNWQKGHRVVDRKTTGDDGTVRFTRGGESGSHFLLARRGDAYAFDASYLGFYKPTPPSEVTNALLYTDRSIYRPGQKLYWKALVYRGRPDQARLTAAANQTVGLTLYDLNNNAAAQATVTTNAYGTASGEFVIPAGRPLGGWRLQSAPYGSASLRVEEYKRPTFDATFLPAKGALRLNRPATLTGEAKYYFGLPVVNGKAAWTVKRVRVYPWWWGWYYGSSPAREQLVASGVSPLKEDGTFEVAFTPAADERDSAGGAVTFRYSVSADVTDEGGETRTATRTFRLGFVSVEASLELGEGFVRGGEPAQFTVSRTDLDGAPRAGKGSWTLFALRQPEKALLPAEQPLPAPPPGEGPQPFRTPGDLQRPRWAHGYSVEQILRSWEDGPQKSKGDLTHGEKGRADLELPALPPGAYRIRYETTDDFGAKCATQKEFVVGAARTPVALPFLLRAERDSVPVGETARFLLHSALEGQPLVFERYRAGALLERRRIVAGKEGEVLEIPVGEQDRGGFAVRLTLLRDYQLVSEAESVFVPWDDRELEVSFTTFRDKMRPGGTETWRVAVKSPGGTAAEAGAAELLAYMYDKSLDLFGPHHPPSPLGLYPNRAGVVSYADSLGAAPQVYTDESGWYSIPGYPSFSDDRLIFFDAYGIGGPGRRSYMMDGVVGGAVAESAMPPPAPAAAPMLKAAAPMQSRAKGEVASNEAPREEEADEKKDGGAPPAAGGEVQLRSNFAETAFWEPHLVTDKDGTAAIEFTVPDSVTAWNVWVHAVTRDLKAGSLHKETRSVKDLMVRPYVPRFFREGDRAELKVVVNNASERDLSGQVTLEIFDPQTQENLAPAFGLPAVIPAKAFTVKPGGGANVTFPVAAPARVGTVAFKVVAKAGDLSDGELRPLPVLPGRMHLVQSRFVTLRAGEKRELVFEDLSRTDDPSRIHEQLVVTVDAQLFYGLLEALPYLVNYPYECTEQTLNRFLSTGILASLYDQYPSVGKMAQEFSKRDTPLETWDQADPNRKMTLEESPWLEAARGGKDAGSGVEKVLDPRVAKAQRDASLAKLLKAQTSLGAWPWWAGGPPSPYMTLYIVYGFSKALEFGVEVPKQPVVDAFSYLHRHYLDECVREMMAHDVGWEFVTFLNYVISNYPDESWTGGVFTAADRKQMLDFSFKHWKDHSPYLKGYLTLTLKRMGRPADAKLVWDSVMDSAKTTRDEGTSWAPEDRGWLWYNDTVETHAFALRTLMELDPKDTRSDGLVQWIYLNKKLNHWESTRATAEVLYSVAHFLKTTGALGVRESIAVAAGPVKAQFDFEPDRYTGKKNQVVIPGEKVDGATMSKIAVSKEGKGFAFASATWHFSTEKLPEKGDGDLFSVTRTYFRRESKGEQVTLTPLAEGAALAVGDEIEVQLSLRSKHPAEYVHLRDPRPAGCEPVTLSSGYRWDLGLARYEEVRDSGQNFFMEWLPQGEYTLKYRIRCSMAGTFRVGPATVQSMYAPEFNAYSAGHVVAIKGE